MEPLLLQGKVGGKVAAVLKWSNATATARTIAVTLDGRGRIPDRKWSKRVPAGGSAEEAVEWELPPSLKPGRYVFALRNSDDGVGEGVDAFVVVDAK